MRGQLLELKGDATMSEACLRVALHQAAEQKTKSFELRAATALAKLLLAAGDGDEARAVLAPVYGWFTEGNTTADLVGARTLLSEIG